MLCRSPLQTMLANLQIRYHYLQALHEHCKITKGWLRIRLWLITSKCYSFLIRTKLWQSPNPLCKQQQSTKWAAGIQLHFDHTQSTLCLHWCLLASYCASHSSSHLHHQSHRIWFFASASMSPWACSSGFEGLWPIADMVSAVSFCIIRSGFIPA